jgi:hypothetical protein
LNLIPELDGKLPEDREKMLRALDWYLDLPEEDKLLYRVGRRTGMMNGAEDFADAGLRERAARICEQNDIHADNIDGVAEKLMNRFI